MTTAVYYPCTCLSFAGQNGDCPEHGGRASSVDHDNRAPRALERCPFCEGSGGVPTSSGLTDTTCLCTLLDYTGRLIADGRLEYAQRCLSAADACEARGDSLGASFQWRLAVDRREQARHIIYGCGYGACTGNAGEGPCIAAGVLVCDACDRPIRDGESSSSDDELTVCRACSRYPISA